MNNSTESWAEFGPERDSLYIVIPVTLIYLVIFLTGLVGNVITCIVISRNRHMHTATNYYLFSLACSDLLLLVSGLPQEMYMIWSRYPYIFGEAFCVLRGLAAETSANATVLTITAFTVERYVAICHPFLSHTLSKLSRAVKLILCIWLLALLLAVPQALQFGLIDEGTIMCASKRIIIEHSFEISTFVFFVAPMALITVLYALIGLRLRRSNLLKSGRGSFSTHDDGQRKGQTFSEGQGPLERKKRRGGIKGRGGARKTVSMANRSYSCRHYTSPASRRVVKMLVAVVVAFFICWAPFHAQRLVAIYGINPEDDREHSDLMMHIYTAVTYVSGVLYYLSTTINPLLYHIMSHKFRAAFKETLGLCCGRRKLRRDTNSCRQVTRTGSTSDGPRTKLNGDIAAYWMEMDQCSSASKSASKKNKMALSQV